MIYPKTFIRPRYKALITKRLTSDGSNILLLQGGRETGKTTLLGQILDESLYPFDGKRYFFSFEQSHNSLKHKNLQEWIQFLKQHIAINISEPSLLLLNEIQYNKNSMKYLLEMTEVYPHIRIVATGYGIANISQKSISIIIVYPFSFREFLLFQDNASDMLTRDDPSTLSQRSIQFFQTQFEVYIKWGGFFRVHKSSTEFDKHNAIAYIIKKYIDTDAKFWFEGDFLSICHKALGPLHTMTDHLLKPITLAKDIKLSPYNTKKIIDFFLRTYWFQTIECLDIPEFASLSGHQISYSIDTGLLHHFIPYAYSTELYYRTYCLNEMKRTLLDIYPIKTIRKKNGSIIDFCIENPDMLLTLVFCSSKSTALLPKILHALPARFIDRIKNIIIVNPSDYELQSREGKPLQFVPYYRFSSFLRKLFGFLTY